MCVVFSCGCIGVSIKSVILTSETLERLMFPVNLNQGVTKVRVVILSRT